MPKKFAGENSKAAAAKARKTAAKEEEERRREKEKADELWREDDKLILKKQQRKEQQEKKKLEQLQKKAELKVLLEKEDLSLKPLSKQSAAKVTKHAVLEQERKNAAALAKKKEPTTHLTVPLEENVNRLEVDGLEARSVTEAISILSTRDDEECRHPQKRMKAAFAAFKAANLPRIKAENPTLKFSQWQQILNKEWMRSPMNPMNQRKT